MRMGNTVGCSAAATREFQFPGAPPHDRAAIIEANDVERVLANIDADHGDCTAHRLVGHGDAPVLSEGCEPLIFKTGRPVRLSGWARRLPQRPTARAV